MEADYAVKAKDTYSIAIFVDLPEGLRNLLYGR
jgi:hypothetical protein